MTLHNEQDAIQQAVEAGWLYAFNPRIENNQLTLRYGDCLESKPLDGAFTDQFWQTLP